MLFIEKLSEIDLLQISFGRGLFLILFAKQSFSGVKQVSSRC